MADALRQQMADDIASLVRKQTFAGSGVWRQSGNATLRIETQTDSLVNALQRLPSREEQEEEEREDDRQHEELVTAIENVNIMSGSQSSDKKGGGLFGALGRAFTGGKERESGFSKENYDQGRLSRKDFSSRKDYVEYMKQFDDKENKGFFSKLFGGKKNENVKKNDYFVNPEDATNMSDVPRYVKDAGGNFVVAPTTEQLTKGFSTYDDDDFTKSEKKENKGIFGGLFGGGKKETQSGFSKENYDMGRLSRKDFKNDEDFEFYKNQFGDAFDVDSVKSDDKRGLFGMIGGSVDAMTGGLTDLDRRGGKPFG